MVEGLAIISLTTIFLPVSGAHTNPAISLAAALIHRISPLRSAAYVVAQCGGAIAGASVVLGLYGASEHFPTTTVTNFGLEFLLSFMIVLVYLRVTDDADNNTNIDPPISIGLSYMAALTAYKGAVNPALALGQAFVVSKFSHHWVFWVGPILGGSCAALCHEYIFNEQKDLQLSLTNVESSEEELENEEQKEDNHKTSKFSNNVQNKEEDQIPPTPPLPWNVRRPIRSYLSEMSQEASYPRRHDEEGVTDWDSYEQDPCVRTKRGYGYTSGSSSKSRNGCQKPQSKRKPIPDYNSHSLTRSKSHNHSNKTRQTSTLPISKDHQNCQNSSKSPHLVTRKAAHDSHYFVNY